MSNSKLRGNKILSLLLALCLTLGMLPVTAFAAGGVCVHEHGADCGYIEGADCNSDHDEHDADCGYIEAVDCDHIHDADCGGLTPGDSGDTATPGNAAAPAGAGIAPAAAPAPPAPATVPSVPLNLTATPGDRQVELNWSEPTDNGGSEIIRYELSANGGVTWYMYAYDLTYTVSSLAIGIEYTFWVRAVNAEGPGPHAIVSSTPNALPTVTSAATTVDGTKVIVTFSKDMSASGLVATDFTVNNGSANVVTAIALGSNAATVELMLTTAVEGGQTVTVAYTKGTAKAADGTMPDSFSARAVTNNVPNTSAPPVITSPNSAAFPVGAYRIFTVTASNEPDSFAIGGATLPTGVSFNPSTGELSGTPDLGTHGIYNLTFTATNTAGTSAVQNFTLTASSVTNAAELKSALESASPSTISVTGNITFTELITMGASHTLSIDNGCTVTASGSGEISIGGNTLTINGGGIFVSEKDYGHALSGYGTLNLENITVDLQNTTNGGIAVTTLNVGSGATVNLDSATGRSLILLSSGDTLNVNTGGTIDIMNFVGTGISNYGTININGGTININGGTISDNSISDNWGIYNYSGLLKYTSGALTAANDGAIELAASSKVDGMGGKLKDRGTEFTAAGQVTVSAATASPSATGLTEGLYVWDGSFFTKQVITISAESASLTVTAGAITQSLSVTATTSNSETISYQWLKYNSTTGLLESIPSATSAAFAIPTGLTAGTYYYLCRLTATGCGTVYTNYITVTVNPGSSLTPVTNTGGTGTATYAGATIDLSGVSGLFTVGVGAGARTYTIDGGTGTGTIGVDNKTLTVTKAGTFTIGLVTAATGTHAAGAKVTATLTVNKGAQSAPTGLGKADATTYGAADGKITGLTASRDYAYRKDSGGYTPAISNGSGEITGLAAGSYVVRLAATDLYNDGANSAAVVIGQPAPTYTATLTVNKDGAPFTAHGKTFTLKLSTNEATTQIMSGTDGTVTATVGNGTWKVYDGTTDTGATINISGAAGSATLNYYTVQFAVANAGDAAGSTISAVYNGSSINTNTVVLGGKTLILIATGAGATRYTYLWSGTGTSGQTTSALTFSPLSGELNATCTVTGTGTATVTGITVKTQPTTLTYTDGQTLNLAGLEVTLALSDSSTQDVAYADFGTYGIAVSYTNGGTATQGDALTVAHNGKTFTLTCNAHTAVTNALTVNAARTNNGGGGSGGGGGGGGGSSGTNYTSGTNTSNVSRNQATDAAKKAAAAAKAAGSGTATVNMKNVGNIPLAALQAMAKAAGMPMNFQSDSMSADGKNVDVRITLDPAKSTKGIDLSASTTSERAKSTETFFENHFNNNVSVVSLGQQGIFGQPVEIAAKIDSKLDTSKLVFYAYDKATNTYKRIEEPAYWIDKNGYVHFTTDVGGDIVITDKPLEKNRSRLSPGAGAL